MNRGVIWMLAWVLGSGLSVGQSAASSELLSKRYLFENDVVIKTSAEAGEGLRLDTVHFKMPVPKGDRLVRSGGLPAARVAVSNTSGRSIKVAVAIALFDGEGRMLAVARASKMSAVRAGRQKTLTLYFDGVNAEAHKAAEFQISVESKR
jgi:hypothetical protein